MITANSSTDWLGELPAGWGKRPLKRMTVLVNGYAFKPDEWSDEGTPIIRIENLNGSGDFNRTLRAVDSRYEVRAGDLLFGWSGNKGTSFGPFLWRENAVDVSSERWLLNQHIFRLDGYTVHKRWFYWALRAATSFIEQQTHGIIGMVHITKEDLGRILLPDIPWERQRAIADYLDAETAVIDALIEQKMLMIDLLTERLASLIEEVMRTPPGAPTPSLSSVVQIAEGQVDPRQLPYSEYPLIAPNHVESGSGRLLGIETASSQGAISGKYLCEPGSVIYSKIRPALQKVCIAPTRCLTSADMYPMTPRAGLKPEYLFYFLLSTRFTDFAVMESERVAMPKINRDAFGRIRIPLPTPDDQDRAVAELDGARLRSERVSDKLRQQVALLQEHRQALITAAVMGELELPGAAA